MILDLILLTIIYGVAAVGSTLALVESVTWRKSSCWFEWLLFTLLAAFFWYQLLRVWGLT